MTDIGFYHMTGSPLERVLPKLLEKTLAAGKRAVVLAGSGDRVGALNTLLWTYHQDSWLPHGTGNGDSPADQPVWLTNIDENPNDSEYLFLTDGAVSGRVEDFQRCFELFDGNQPAAVEAARERWTAYKEAGHAVTYWKQTERGGWEEAG